MLTALVAAGATIGAAPVSAAIDDGAVDKSSGAALQDRMAGLDYQIDLSEAPGDVVIDADGTITYSVDGSEMVVSQDGTWTIGPAVQQTGAAVTTLAYPISLCVGTFFDARKVNSRLEHGAEQTCSAGAYPHSFQYELRSTCSGVFCLVFGTETGRLNSTGSHYGRVVRIHLQPACETSTKRRYQQIVYPVARGVQYPPVINSNEPTIACDISA